MHPWMHSFRHMCPEEQQMPKLLHFPAGCRARLGFGSAQEQACSQCYCVDGISSLASQFLCSGFAGDQPLLSIIQILLHPRF